MNSTAFVTEAGSALDQIDLSGPVAMPEAPPMPETEPDTKPDTPDTEPAEPETEPADPDTEPDSPHTDPDEPNPDSDPATPDADPDDPTPDVPEEERPFLDPAPTTEPSECPQREGDGDWETCSLPERF